jgi:D-arabinose 1-dehydrogenase-like Zn-dependent alcohol dehydrogenase
MERSAMRQIWITKAGPPEVLQLKEAPDPEPKAGEVRIRVEASGINFADILGRLWLYPDLPPIPVVPGYEVGGRIDALGAGVDARWAGRNVFALTRFGGYADIVCVPLAQVFERPEGMSAGEGAAIPVNYFTAWQLCVVMGGLKSGETVLVHSGGWGRRHCRNPDRQAYRSDRHRDCVCRKACRNARVWRRSSDRLPDRGFRSAHPRDHQGPGRGAHS